MFTVGQKFAIEFCGNNYLVTVGGISNDVMQLVEGDATRWMNEHLLIIIK